MSNSAGRTPRLAALILACALAALAPDVQAAWESVPEVSLYVDTDDNILLDPVNEQSGSRSALEARIRLSNLDERGNFYAQPRVVTDAYADSSTSQFESDDVYFDMGGGYDWRTVQIGFRSRYSEEKILHSEFVGANPGDPDIDPGDEFIDPDTGRLEAFSEDRTLFDLRSNVDFRMSERSSFRFEAGRQDVEYTGDQSTFLSDYENDFVAMAVVRRVDPRNTVTARIVASEFYAQRNDNRTDSVGIEGTFRRPLAPTWTLNLTAGVQRSKYNFLRGLAQVDNAATNSTFRIGFAKRAERMRWDMNLGHVVQPNGNGYLVVRDELRLGAVRQLKPRLTLDFGARFSETETLDDVNAQDSRDYLTVTLGLEWAIRRTLFFDVGLERYTQEFINENAGDATSNVLSLGITYRGLSRQDQ